MHRHLVWYLSCSLVATVLLFGWSGQARAEEPQPPAAAKENGGVSADHAARLARGLQLFRQRVESVLVGRCVKCHGGEKTEAEFDLTTREKMLRGGADGPVYAADKLDQARASRLFRVVAHLEEPFMPEGGEKLSPADLDAFAQWLEAGAPYEHPLGGKEADPSAWTRREVVAARREFWSFQPLGTATPPAVTPDEWSRTPIDRFLLAAAKTRGVSPNPLADRRTLLRRVYFDLLGLPPSPAEVEQFLADTSPEAYRNLVRRLLDSPHYGERWGRHWLDVARFGESHGFEQDYDRPYAYHYRDFVIRALNQDLPYDQFVRWQIAGDELEPENPLALMATGFLGAGVFPTQLTEKEFEPARYDELDDMVSTMGTAFLGLTLGCCRCHDHKYDPIPSADYYRLAAHLATTIRSEIDLDLDPEGSRRAQETFAREHEPLVAALREYETRQTNPQFAAWLKKPADLALPSAQWRIVTPASMKSLKGATLAQQEDGSILVHGENPKQDQYQIVFETRLRGITAIRLETLSHPSLPKGGPGRANNGNFALSDLQVTARPLNDPQAKPVKVKLVAARATHEQDTGHLSVRGAIDDGYESGWAVDRGGIGKDQAAVFDLERPLDLDGGVQLTLDLKFQNNVQHSIGRPRFSLATTPAPVEIAGDQVLQALWDAGEKLQRDGESGLNPAERETLRRHFAERDPQWRKLQEQVAQHDAQRPRPTRTKVMVTSEGFKPIPHHADGRGFPHFYPDVYFLRRGDSQQKQGVATPGFVQVLMASPDAAQRWTVERPASARTSYRRRALANWLTDAESGAGQLLARVIVNRLWHHHFGRGLVGTPNDFGFQGERPSHPELLDWLARQLIAGGWRLKPIHELLLTSAAYQQSSAFDADDARLDPDNRLLWRFTPRRLEAETIRDTMLAVSGELDRTQFGPGTLDEAMKRRSIYFMIKRSKLVPMMQLFDVPEPLVGVGDRPSTTIAPQALVFLNNPQVRGYARSMGQRFLDEARGDRERAVRIAYRAGLARDPAPGELQSALAFLNRQVQSYQNDQQTEAEKLALADLSQVILSLNEFIYLD